MACYELSIILVAVNENSLLNFLQNVWTTTDLLKTFYKENLLKFLQGLIVEISRSIMITKYQEGAEGSFDETLSNEKLNMIKKVNI